MSAREVMEQVEDTQAIEVAARAVTQTRNPETNICPICYTEFKRRGNLKRFCSTACQQKAYYLANKEALLARNKLYKATHPERLLEKARAWRIANRERIRQVHKEWRDCNKDRLRAQRQRHKNLDREYRRAHYLHTGDKVLRNLQKYPYPEACEMCGRHQPTGLKYHHWDEAEPSKGAWLCWTCHRFAHLFDKGLGEAYITIKAKREVGTIYKTTLRGMLDVIG